MEVKWRRAMDMIVENHRKIKCFKELEPFSLFPRLEPGGIEFQSFNSQTHYGAEQKPFPVFPVHA